MPASPTRSLAVAPERLERWLAGFADRHGPTSWDATPDLVTVRAADGAALTARVPFPPLAADPSAPYGGLVAHAVRDRTVGVLLVRRGGHAVGVFQGRRLVASKVGARYVQGRTAAGGQSQQRFARRRERQAREAFQAAAEVAVRLLLPRRDTLHAVVLGGDRLALGRVLADRRLAGLDALAVPGVLRVGEPRLATLLGTADQFRAVQISVFDPEAGPVSSR